LPPCQFLAQAHPTVLQQALAQALGFFDGDTRAVGLLEQDLAAACDGLAACPTQQGRTFFGIQQRQHRWQLARRLQLTALAAAWRLDQAAHR